MTIVANAGIDGAIVIGKLIEQDDLSLGYDAAKGLCCTAVNCFWTIHSKFEWLQQYHVLFHTLP
jgi:hypothetical protein